MHKEQKGFTLIELLVVIGIIAILAVVVILTINPAELLRQARDSTRISDLATLKAAISLYLADVTTPHIASNSDSYTDCWVSDTTVGASCGVFASGQTGMAASASASSSKAVNGNGWLPVNFTSMSAGSPIGTLPLDPINNSTYYYAYAASSSLTFEIDAKMESTRYKSGGSGDVESTDGGDKSTEYEVGTAPGLAL